MPETSNPRLLGCYMRTRKHIYFYYKIMYWGTAKWTPVEIFETYSMARTLHCIAPLCEYAEYHPFHREKVEKIK